MRPGEPSAEADGSAARLTLAVRRPGEVCITLEERHVDLLRSLIGDFAGLVSFVLTAVSSVLISRWIEDKKHSLAVSLAGVTVLAAVFYVAADYTQSAIHSSFERSVSGTWLEIYRRPETGLVTYSVAAIEFDPRVRKLRFHGNAYDKEGTRVGKWDSTKVLAAADEMELYYFYEGHILRPLPGDSVRGMDLLGAGQIKFQQADGRILGGWGNFREFKKAVGRVDFELTRVTKEMCQTLISKDVIETPGDQQRFVVAYHKASQNEALPERERSANQSLEKDG